MSRLDTTAYTRTAIVLHWLIAVLILVAFPVGLYMVGLKLSPQKLAIYSWHKWAGMTVLALMVLRLIWRMTHRPPALPDSMRPLEKRLAQLVHWMLYLLMVAVPLAGWLFSSAKGFPVVWFGVLPLPDLVGKDAALAEILHAAHEVLAWTLIVLVAGHAAAAIKHHVVARDDVLTRMLPFLKRIGS
ncbi:MAG: cytochrome b [Betaproteobacteria bacterium]|nr:cytochrome b [Betaproteobacteria bacterium]